MNTARSTYFLPRPGAVAADGQSDPDDFGVRKRAQERIGPWIERLRERYSEAFAIGRDYYERTKDEAKRGLASARSGEFHS